MLTLDKSPISLPPFFLDQTERYEVVVAGNLNIMIDHADRVTGRISQQEVGIQKEICKLLKE